MSWLIVILTFLLVSFKTEKNSNYSSVSVVIPAYNEEKNIANVIEVIKKVSYVNEIIVVNDGSTDLTKEVAEKAGAKVISHLKNLGKGAAIKTGYKETDSDIIAFIDGDIHNLTTKKLDLIIKPILLGKTEITKTKFERESGRVTELTAKPLLNFFFPEINFEQPLSGQFAAKRDVLKKIKFEKDYGVDVGIVLDADVQGISIKEVDIGEIKHDLSPLKDLNLMANEVVRTIINRATEYGRVTIIDDLGNYIRLSILGLSLVILGLFTIFFVKLIPLEVGILISISGVFMAVHYLIKLIIKSFKMFKKTPNRNLIKSFIKIHFPILISGIILILMLSTFLGAATINNGVISIEPNSRNLLIYSDDSNNTISVRGPFSIDSAIENESNIIRVPEAALDTLGINYGDSIIIDNVNYSINKTRDGEPDILRLPNAVKKALNFRDGDILQNSRLNQAFEGSIVCHNYPFKNNTNLTENFLISSKSNGYSFSVYFDNISMGSSSGNFKNNTNYNVFVNNQIVGSLDFYNNSFSKDSYNFYHGNHTIKIIIKNSNKTSIKHFLSSDEGSFLEFKIKD